MSKVANEAVDRLKKDAASNGDKGVKADTQSLVGITSNKRLEFFQKYAPQISQLIPQRDDLNAARIVQLAVQLTDDNKIAECHPKSIIGAVMQSVILGFEPIPGLGLAAFIPYAKKLTFQIMYQGLIDLAYRTDMYDAIYADVVREGDVFKYNRGLRPDIIHEPKVYKGDITHCYAVAYLKGSGQPMFVVQPWEEIIEIRNRSSHGYTKPDSPWQTRPGEQGKKTVLKNLMKILPKSVQMQKAVVSDERTIDVDDFNKGTREVDYGKMAEDATFQDIPDKKEPEPEKKAKPKAENKEKPDESEPEPAKSEPEPEKTVDNKPEPEKEPEKPDSDEIKGNPLDPISFELFGKPYKNLDKEEGQVVLQELVARNNKIKEEVEESKRDKDTPDIFDKDQEDEEEPSFVGGPGDEKKDESWGDDDEVEEAAKSNTEEVESKVDDLKSETLLKDAFEESEYKRMIKYLRERANDAKQALAAYRDDKAPNGIHNLGELCAYFEINALTAYDITAAQYEEIKDFITEVKKQIS